MEKDYESLPESQLIFRETSVDGSVTVTVWRDAEPITEVMKHIGAMGILTVSSTRNNTIYAQERLPLSPSAIFGPGPTEKEIRRWTIPLSRLADE